MPPGNDGNLGIEAAQNTQGAEGILGNVVWFVKWLNEGAWEMMAYNGT